MIPKPLYSQPCTHCGSCCYNELCPVAEIIFGDELCVKPPCPALFVNTKGETLCNIVITEEYLPVEKRLASISLGIGCGCSMPDDNTTEKQISEHNEKARRIMKGWALL